MAVLGRGALAALALAAGLAAGQVRAAPPAGVTGNWLFHVDWGPALRYDMLCHLADEAGKLSGACQGVTLPIAPAAGVIEPASVEFEYPTTWQSYDITVHYQGKRDPSGAASGSILFGSGVGDFTGSAVRDFTRDQTAAWSMPSRLPGGVNYDLFCLFRHSGKQVRGPCAAAGGPVMLPDGTVGADKIAFEYDTMAGGRQVRSRFEGRLDAKGVFSGQVSSEIGGSGVFVAHRR